ncbi:hypothetical protein NQ318_021249 [Aromia moschata]|uniref:Helix-turn-helix domain-containing protein n=1 Tax=Aromia moschata TaxID=1265417 RepID=A0AAV8ZBA3_9CUCU|nr:hypothetical protein NQ318_021249 [Aromia moschata]
MEAFEEETIRGSASEKKPKCWIRYVDDTFIIWPHGISSLTVFFYYLNTLHTNLKFTMETEKDGVLSFLDVLVKRTAETICDDESRPEELKQIKEALMKNGYKEKDIDRVCRTQRTRVEQQPTTYACLPYVVGVTDKLKKTLSKKNIGVLFRTLRKIQQVLPSNKDPVPRLLTKCVYELKCTCRKSYIGQTGRSIQCRIKEHQRHTRLGNTDKSAIAEHVHTNENHKIDCENIRVLDKTTRYYPRVIRESLEIMKNNSNFNREGGYRLSNTWILATPRTSDLECHGQPSSADVQPNMAEPRRLSASQKVGKMSTTRTALDGHQPQVPTTM